MTKILKHPVTLIFSFLLAVTLAVFFKNSVIFFEKPGEIYLSLLGMCVLPILMLALIASLGHTTFTLKFSKTISFYAFVLMSFTVFGILISTLVGVGSPISENSAFLRISSSGANAQELIVDLNEPLEKTQSIMDIIRSLFTSNLFKSLQESLILQVVVFSVFFGCALSQMTEEKKRVLLPLVSSAEGVFRQILSWILLFLPFGIVCIFAPKLSNLSAEVLGIFANVILIVLLVMIAAILLMNFLIGRRLGVGFFKNLSLMKDVIIISASTGSPIATMPTFMKTLSEKYGFDIDDVDIYVPLTISTFRFGNAFYLGFLAILTAQIFAIPLGLFEYINILLLAFLTSFAAASSGIVNIGLLGTVLASIGVPSSLAITLYAAFDPLIDPIRTTFTMYGHFFSATFSFGSKNRNGFKRHMPS